VDRELVVRILLTALGLGIMGCGVSGADAVPQPMTILVPYVGQGSGVVVERSGQALLFDAGPESSSVLSDLLRSRGRTTPCLLVVSHWDGDHVGGLDSLVARGQVAEVLHGGGPIDPWMARRKAEWCRRIPLGCRQLRRGQVVDLADGSRLEVAGSDPEAQTDNARSLVVRLVDERGTGVVLAPGDLDTTGEAALLAAGTGLSAHVLLVGHHGSRGSSSLPFLGAVRPRIAFVQAGQGNTYGHPHAQAMERLVRVVPDVRRTTSGWTEIVNATGP
jgi:competence protein ComEC